MQYFLTIIATAAVSLFLCLAVRRLAARFGFMDVPDEGRHRHKRPTPLLGGLGIFLAIFLVVALAILYDQTLLSSLFAKNLAGLFFATLVIVLGGVLDDKLSLAPGAQIAFPAVASVIVIASGIGIAQVQNPFGGIVDLSGHELGLFWYSGTLFKITLLADAFTFVWLMGMAYTTKVLDAVDGLVSGLAVIGALMLLAFSLTSAHFDPAIAILASIVAGGFLGFLVLNWHPAKMFLGEGGSLLAGFLLAALAILSGSKVAIAFLVMGIPVLDLAWVIFQRKVLHKKSPFRTADRRHLSLRLVDLGLSQRKAVLLFYFLAILFGALAILLQAGVYLWALVLLGAVMAGLIIFVSRKGRQKDAHAT